MARGSDTESESTGSESSRSTGSESSRSSSSGGSDEGSSRSSASSGSSTSRSTETGSSSKSKSGTGTSSSVTRSSASTRTSASTVTGSRSGSTTESSRTERATSSSRTNTNTNTQTGTSNSKSGTTTTGTRSGTTNSASRSGTTTDTGTRTGTTTTESDTRTGTTKQVTTSGTGTGTGTTSSSRTGTETSGSRSGTTTATSATQSTSRSGTTTSGSGSGTRTGTSSGTGTGTTGTSGTSGTGTTTGTTSGTKSGSSSSSESRSSGSRSGSSSQSSGSTSGSSSSVSRSSGSSTGTGTGTSSGSGSGSTSSTRTEGSTASSSTEGSSSSRTSGSTTSGTGSGSGSTSTETTRSSGSTDGTSTSSTGTGTSTSKSSGSTATSSSSSSSTGTSSSSGSTDSSSSTSSSTPSKALPQTKTTKPSVKDPKSPPEKQSPPSPFDTESLVSTKPSIKDSVKESTKKSTKESAKESTKKPEKESTKESGKKSQEEEPKKDSHTSSKKQPVEGEPEKTAASDKKSESDKKVTTTEKPAESKQQQPTTPSEKVVIKSPPTPEEKSASSGPGKNAGGGGGGDRLKMEQLKHGLDVIPLLDQKKSGEKEKHEKAEEPPKTVAINVDQTKSSSSSTSSSTSSSSTSSEGSPTTATSDTSSDMIAQMISSPTKVRQITPTFTVGGAEVKSKISFEQKIVEVTKSSGPTYETHEKLFSSWFRCFQRNASTMSLLLENGSISNFNTNGSVGTPTTTFSVETDITNINNTYATVTTAVQKHESNEASKHTALYVFSKSSLKFDPSEKGSFLVSVPTSCSTSLLVISIYSLDDCLVGWGFVPLFSEGPKNTYLTLSMLKGTPKALSSIPLEMITKMSKTVSPPVSMNTSISKTGAYSSVYLSPLDVVWNPNALSGGCRSPKLHSVYYTVPKADDELPTLMCKLSSLSVSVPGSESLERTCKKYFSEWGVSIPAQFTPQLELEILGHNGCSTITRAIQFPLQKVKGKQAVYSPPVGNTGREKAVSFKLPCHSMTALLFHIIWVFNERRIAFGVHAHLCCPKGDVTTDSSSSHRSVSCVRGMLISHNNLVVSDAISANFATPPSADYVLSNLSISYNADVTGTPETKRRKAAKKKAKLEKQQQQQQQLQQQPPSKPDKRPDSRKEKIAKHQKRPSAEDGIAIIRRHSPDKTPLNITQLPATKDTFTHQPYCNGTCGGKCSFIMPQIAVPTPSVRHEVQVVSIEPESLFLLPAFKLNQSDRDRLASFPYKSISYLKSVKEQVPETAFCMPDSEILFDFKAVVNPTEDLPSRTQFRIGMKTVGEVQTDVGTLSKDPHFKSDQDSPCHAIISESGGYGCSASCVIRNSPVTKSYMETGLVHVDIINADNGFVWGFFQIDLYKIHRHPNIFVESESTEIPILDAMGVFVDQKPPDTRSPSINKYPDIKGTLAFTMVNKAIPSVVEKESPEKVRKSEKRQRKVIAKKILHEGIADSLKLNTTIVDDDDDVGKDTKKEAKKQQQAPVPSSKLLIHFKCESTADPLAAKWPLATTSIVNQHLHTVARSMDEVCGPWEVAQLDDGYIKGRAHGCVIGTGLPPNIEQVKFPFRIVYCEGPLPKEDQKMMDEAQQHALRRARASFAKDKLLQQMGKVKPQQSEPKKPAGKEAVVFEEKLEIISRLRTKGKRKEELLKAQLHSQLTSTIKCEAVVGEATLIEIEVENKFGIGYTFQIDIRDDNLEANSEEELTVINSMEQWSLLARHSGLSPPPTNTITDATGRIFSRSEVALPAQGKTRVPLQFLSFRDGICGRPSIQSRIIIIYIRDRDNTPRQIYQVTVVPRDSSTAVTRVVSLYGCRGEQFCRWIRLGNATDATTSANKYINKDSKLASSRKRLRVVRCSATHGRLTSFIDYQNTTLGNLIPAEILQLEDRFSESDNAPDNLKSFYVFIYDSPDCLIPSETLLIRLVTCLEISAKRNMGETSELMIPLPSGTGDGVKCCLSHGFVGEAAGPGDFKCKILHGGSYTKQGFVLAVRPIDDTPRRLLLHAMSGSVVRENYIVSLQGVPSTALSSAPQTIPVPFDGKTRSYTVDFTNPSLDQSPATFHVVYSPHVDITVEPRSVTLNSGQSSVFTITLRPSSPQLYNFILWFNNKHDLTVKLCKIDFDVKEETKTSVKLIDVNSGKE